MQQMAMASAWVAPVAPGSRQRLPPIAAMGGVVLPSKFGYVALTAASSVLLTQWQAVQVGVQRRKAGLKYPKMYEDAEDSIFNCYQRAHQNTLESYPAFLALLLVAGLGYPITASIFGMIWVIGRVFYSLGYYTGDPNNRLKGIWNAFGLLGLLFTSIVFGCNQGFSYWDQRQTDPTRSRMIVTLIFLVVFVSFFRLIWRGLKLEKYRMLPEKRTVGEDNSGNLSKRARLGDTSGTVELAKVQEFVMGGDGAPSEVSHVEIDEDLHSRQLAVYGRETMRRLFGANILISGLQGLGAEIAKNIILAGVKSVTLHDEQSVELSDLSSQFYLSEADVGKNRAFACVDKLKELNNAVAISVLTTELTESMLSNFQVVVFTGLSLKDALRFDEYCHNHNPSIAFIRTDVRGVFGSIFCDFGPEFTVLDVDGEIAHTGIIASISNDNQALVSCVEDERLEFEDGEMVVFSEVKGMVELNDGKPRKVKNTRPYSFCLEEDTTDFGQYEKGGIVTQVKQPKTLNFKTLKEAMTDPGEFLLSDYSKFDRPPLLHLAFHALDEFVLRFGHLPAPAISTDADALIDIAKELNAAAGDEQRLESIDEDILRKFSSGASAVINPMAAMFGGVVGQEIVKACSGKFHPLFQFFYFDSIESLPTEALSVEEVKPLGSRYDAQIAVFGRSVQEKLQNAKVFVVGAGALGCEFLKNLALMGVACGDGGRLTITDDDVIEKSNLSRQFLFRDWNIGQAKSTVASGAALAINPNLKARALQSRMNHESENVFDDAFWEDVDVVVNALDNVNARLYVDSKAVYFKKALLESGTLGPKCNTQMVIPDLTENYGASRDPPERQAPMCTLHSFPHNIDHCLTWARSEFEGLLEKTPSEANAFLSKPYEYKKSVQSAADVLSREKLEKVVECLVSEKCLTFEDCILWARKRFEDYFANRVKQLTFTFPEDAPTSSGTPFWSAPKRFPKALEFSVADPAHLSFVAAGAILRAETYGIAVPDWVRNPKSFSEAVSKIKLPEFRPKQGVKIVTDEKATNMNSASFDDSSVIEQLIRILDNGIKTLPPGFRMNPILFEKDDDTNYHMEFIAGLANMRARNYFIPEVDKLKAKFIAGRIIPAIATTTALATGLVCLEFYKVILGQKVEAYRNSFVNLALPLFSMAEPVPPKTFEYNEMTWSIWDRWVIARDLTMRELLDWFKDKALNPYSISCGQSLLYNSLFPAHRDRLDRKVVELATSISKLNIPPNRRHFDVVVACEDDDGNDLDVPLVSICFR